MREVVTSWRTHGLASLEQEWLSESKLEGDIYSVWKKVTKNRKVWKRYRFPTRGPTERWWYQSRAVLCFSLTQGYTERVLQFSDKNWNDAEQVQSEIRVSLLCSVNTDRTPVCEAMGQGLEEKNEAVLRCGPDLKVAIRPCTYRALCRRVRVEGSITSGWQQQRKHSPVVPSWFPGCPLCFCVTTWPTPFQALACLPYLSP